MAGNAKLITSFWKTYSENYYFNFNQEFLRINHLKTEHFLLFVELGASLSVLYTEKKPLQQKSTISKTRKRWPFLHHLYLSITFPFKTCFIQNRDPKVYSDFRECFNPSHQSQRILNRCIFLY